MTFDGPAPAVGPSAFADRVEHDGAVLRLHTRVPDAATTAVLEAIGDGVRRLRGLEVARPTLESVFLGLTGRSYEPEEVARVA